MKRFVLFLFGLFLLNPFTAQAFDLVVESGDFSVVHDAPAADPVNYDITGPRDAVAAAKYSMKVAVAMPTGTSGATTVATNPSNTKFVPCDNASKTDAVTLTLTYNAVGTAGTVDADVYVIFYNSHDPANKFYMLTRTTFPVTTITVNARADVAAANAAKLTDIYSSVGISPVGTVTETLFGTYLYIVGAPSGTWQVVGIVAPSATVNFDDPSTWKAWDVGTFVIRKPWLGLANTTCT